jgi:hypothetical protein
MNLNVYIKCGKVPGVYTNDRRLMKFLLRHPDFKLWYIILKNEKLDGAAFLYRYEGFIKEVKEIVRKWKKSILSVKNVR